VRIRSAEVSAMGRDTQGVKLISLAQDEKLVGMECVVEE
jgi:DNA gyrase subunit A